MLVFLDLDGVLRRNSAPPARLEAPCLDSFCRALLSLPEAKIVISSGWRTFVSLDGIRGHFPPRFAERIVAVTPVLEGGEPHARYTEILAFLREHATQDEAWVAIDDDSANFPSGAAHVLLIDGETAFDEAAAARLVALLRPAPSGPETDVDGGQ
jgi:hypothetical protein